MKCEGEEGEESYDSVEGSLHGLLLVCFISLTLKELQFRVCPILILITTPL